MAAPDTVVVSGTEVSVTFVEKDYHIVSHGEVGPPGAPGPAGVGLPGPAGAVFFIEPEQGDDGIPVPGPAGPAGAAGAAGTAGPAGAVIFFDAESGEDGAVVPGPPGPAGAPGVGLPGPAGAVMYQEPQDGEDGMTVPGPVGVNGANGAAGATGAAGSPGAPGPVFFFEPESGEDGMSVPGAVGATGAAGSVSLGAVNVFTKNQSAAPSALTSGASIALDASLSNNFKLVLGVNATLANATNPTDGMVVNIRIKQDATGSRTLAYGTAYKWPGGTAGVLSTAANAVDLLSMYFDSTDAVWSCVLQKGFA